MRCPASTVSPSLPACAPPHRARSAAGKAGAAAAQLGCGNESGRARKCCSGYRRAPSTAGHWRRRRRRPRQRQRLRGTGTGCRGCAGGLRALGANEGAVRQQRLPGRALVPITRGIRRALGTAAGPRTHARLPGASSPAQRSPSPRAPRRLGRARTRQRDLSAARTPERKLAEGGCPQPGSCSSQSGSSRPSPGWRREARRMPRWVGATPAGTHPSSAGTSSV